MSTPRTVTGFILAGGQSTRMGRDKALLDWHGQTLLEHMEQLLSGVCDSVTIVGRDELPDEVSGLGPVGGIITALHHTTSLLNIVVAVDLPCLTKQFLIHFKERCIASPRPLTVCKIESGFPLCLGIRTEMKTVVESYIRAGKRSLFGLITGTNHEVVCGVNPQLFTNLNFISEYQQALNLYKP